MRDAAVYAGQSSEAPWLGPRKIGPLGHILESLIADDLAPLHANPNPLEEIWELA